MAACPSRHESSESAQDNRTWRVPLVRLMRLLPMTLLMPLVPAIGYQSHPGITSSRHTSGHALRRDRLGRSEDSALRVGSFFAALTRSTGIQR